MSGLASFRSAALATQAVALASACVAAQTAPPTAPPITPAATRLVISPSAAVPAPASIQRWMLPDLVAWHVDARELLYVTRTAPGIMRVRDLGSGAERSVAAPASRQVVSVALRPDGIGYLAAVGVDRYRPTAFEIRTYRWAGSQDLLLDTIEPLYEGATASLLGPALITSEDRSTLVWTHFDRRGDAVHTELRRHDAGDGPVRSVHRVEGIVFPKAVFGRDVVVWKRPFGAHNSPTSIDTYLISDGHERLLMAGEWSADMSADGRAVFHRGGTAEIRAGLDGARSRR